MVRRTKVKKYYKLNDRIYARELRVIDEQGKQIGVITKDEALKLAQDKELDLVEIAPNAQPPVAKIVDFKKFLYLEERKQKEARKHTKETELKEVRFSPFIGDHDLEVGVSRVRKFLKEGDLVKITVVFRGRQMIHTEFGPKVLAKIMTSLNGQAEIDRPERMEGKRFTTVLKAAKGHSKPETIDSKLETTEEDQTKEKPTSETVV